MVVNQVEEMIQSAKYDFASILNMAIYRVWIKCNVSSFEF